MRKQRHITTTFWVWSLGGVLSKNMKRANTPTNIKIFTILIIVGVVAGMIDCVAYNVHIKKHGIGFFSLIPLNVLWVYIKTYPGNILTALWLLPWVFAFAWIELKEK
jgi:hypothetical protein